MKVEKVLEVLSNTNDVKVINIKVEQDQFGPELQEIISYADDNGIAVSFFDTVEESLKGVGEMASFNAMIVHITATSQVVEVLSMSLLATKDAIQDGVLLPFMMDSKNVKCSRVA